MEISIFLFREELEYIKRWLNYIPKHWNFENILKSTVNDLSTEQLKIILKIRHDCELSKQLDTFIEKIPVNEEDGTIVSLEEYDQLCDINNYFNSNRYELYKFNNDEIKRANEIIENYDELSENEKKEMINALGNEFLIDYVNHILSTKKIVCLNKQLSNNLNNLPHASHRRNPRKKSRKKY